jgi:hypothetical protein
MDRIMRAAQNTLSRFAFIGCALALAGCVSAGVEQQDENSGTVGTSAVKPAQISPDECVNYVQLKRDADYLCELADGTTRALKPGERRSSPLSREEIAQVFLNYGDDSEACLQEAQAKDPKADGKVYIKFEIEAGGRVSSAMYLQERSTYKSEALGKCLSQKVKNWRFPVLSSEETLEISYPFVLVNPDLSTSQNNSSSAPSETKSGETKSGEAKQPPTTSGSQSSSKKK